MKKKILCGILAITISVALTGCGDKEQTETPNNNVPQQTEIEVSTNWPSTKFPQPENCEIVKISDTFDGKQIIVKWANKDAFTNYISVLKSMGEEEISEYEDSTQIVWNTMNIHVSYNELDENLNNILIY